MIIAFRPQIYMINIDNTDPDSFYFSIFFGYIIKVCVCDNDTVSLFPRSLYVWNLCTAL